MREFLTVNIIIILLISLFISVAAQMQDEMEEAPIGESANPVTVEENSEVDIDLNF